MDVALTEKNSLTWLHTRVHFRVFIQCNSGGFPRLFCNLTFLRLVNPFLEQSIWVVLNRHLSFWCIGQFDLVRIARGRRWLFVFIHIMNLIRNTLQPLLTFTCIQRSTKLGRLFEGRVFIAKKLERIKLVLRHRLLKILALCLDLISGDYGGRVTYVGQLIWVLHFYDSFRWS